MRKMVLALLTLMLTQTACSKPKGEGNHVPENNTAANGKTNEQNNVENTEEKIQIIKSRKTTLKEKM